MRKRPYRPPPNIIERFMLKYPYDLKLNVIVGLLGCILLIVSYLLVSMQLREINFLEQQIKGNVFKRTVHQLVDTITKHNIYSSQLLQGNNRGAGKIQGLQEEIGREFKTLLKVNEKMENELKTSYRELEKRDEGMIHPKQLSLRWDEMITGLSSDSSITSFDKHSSIINDLQKLLIYIADKSNLTYDPRMETHYLINANIRTLPEEQDLISSIMILGEKLYKQESLTLEERFQLTTLTTLLLSSVSLSEEFIYKSTVEETTTNDAEERKQILLGPLRTYLDSVENFTKYIKSAILNVRSDEKLTSFHPLRKEIPSPKGRPFSIEELYLLGNDVLQKNNQLWSTISDQIDTYLNARVLLIKKKRYLTMSGVFLALALAVTGGYIVLSESKFFFNSVYDAVVSFSKGDLTARAPPMYDLAFNKMRDILNELGDRIEELIEQLQQSGVQLSLTTTEIAAAARHQEGTVCQQEATVKQILVTVGEISSRAKEFAKTMNDVSRSAEETSSLASIGKNGLTRMEQTMRHMVEASKTIASKLAILNAKAGAITSVITTITKVADQTNLLSLNASIEAEKAGEHGKSFAVIAREIRRLADQTANATLDIEQIVSEIMSAISECVMGVDKFSEEISTGVDQISTASEQLTLIIEGVQRQSTRYENVNRGMQAQSLGAEDINESIMQLSDAAQETTNSIRQFHSAIDQLTIATKEMQISVAKMKK